MLARRFRPLLPIMLGSALAVGCGGLQVRNASIVRTAPDPQGGTRVHVTFEIWEGDDMVHGLPVSALKVLEDGQPATSESISAGGRDDIRPPVVLVLDTSYSMYQARAIPDLKRAASKFQDALTQNGFDVYVYRFANRIEPVGDIAAIPETFDEQNGERFTSLYAALITGFSFSDDAVVVAFSDGADNYSQNYLQLGDGQRALDEVERWVEPPKGQKERKRVVHTIALGDFENERDKDGIKAGEALETISKNGTVSTASDPSALDAVFAKVAERIRSIYIVEFVSPSASGVHEIQLEVRHDRRKAKSEELTFVGGETFGERPPRREPQPTPNPVETGSDDPFVEVGRLSAACRQSSSLDCNKLRKAAAELRSRCEATDPADADPGEQAKCREVLREADAALTAFDH